MQAGPAYLLPRHFEQGFSASENPPKGMETVPGFPYQRYGAPVW
jgi:hypothetical protein